MSGLGGNVRYRSIYMLIPIINENLFCKYSVCQSVGNATKGFAKLVRFNITVYN